MPELKDTDEVLIYPYGGWHYHVKGCWMAPTNMERKESNYIPVILSDLKKLKTRNGGKYVPDSCVERYRKGLPLNFNPIIKEEK